mgnify:CR=1 FL=1
MKIAGTGPIQPSSLRRRSQEKGAANGKFAEQLSSGQAPSGPAPAHQAGAIDGLLSIQEVDEDGRGRRQAKEHGEALLDRLDDIRHALLTGSLNPQNLDRLLKQIRSRRETLSDPQLREILDEIELRAAVELAKMGRMP